MSDLPPASFTSFQGHRRIASGPLATNALAVKKALAAQAAGEPGAVLTFADATGRTIDLDTRGSDEEVLARLRAAYPGEPATADEAPPVDAQPPRGRGRPKLGVVAREVTLLPRHWDWLAAQPGGASVALRKLVEEARRNQGGKGDHRQARERAYHFMSAMAGDFAGFEEASRALFANDRAGLEQRIASWPGDVRSYLLRLAAGGDAAD